MTPDARVSLRQQLKRDEGTGMQKNGRFLPYVCPAGKITIGFGHNLDDNGLTPRLVELLLDDDIDDAIRELVVALSWIEVIDPVRQAVLVNMAFNMGVPKLLKFTRMLAALKAKDYETAAIEMLTSKWAAQVGNRSLRLAEQMRSGKFV